jgi:hypothetical protein
MTWKNIFTDSYSQQRTVQKLKDAEDRLNDTLGNLLHRWINVEHTPKRQIMDKLDVSFSVFNKLTNFFNLDNQVEINKKNYLQTLSKKSQFVISKKYKE